MIDRDPAPYPWGKPYYPWGQKERSIPYYPLDTPLTHVYRIHPPGEAGVSHIFPTCGPSRFGFTRYEVESVWTLWPRTEDPYATTVKGRNRPSHTCSHCRKGWVNGRRPPEPRHLDLTVTGRAR